MKSKNENISIRKLSQKYAFNTIKLHESVGRKAGLTGTDHKYLGFIIQKGKMTAGELAVLSGLSTGAVTSLIDRFEKKNLVKRGFDKNDRRKIIIIPITENITKLLEPLYRDYQNKTDDLLATFNTNELEIISKYFNKNLELIDNIIKKLNNT